MSADDDRAASEAPTSIRHWVVFATFCTSVLLYLDRFCMNYAQRYVKEDLGLDDRHIAWCMSAFFVSYALAQVPSGWLTDLFGARKMLAVYILVWSFFTAAMGWAMGLAILLAVRLGAGLGQAGAYPTAAAIVGHWVPFRRRGLASAVVAFGGRVGGAAAPILTAWLVIASVPGDVPMTLSGPDLLDPLSFPESLTSPDDREEELSERDDSKQELTEDERAAVRVAEQLRLSLTADQRAALLSVSSLPGGEEERRETATEVLLPIVNGWIQGPVIGPAEQVEFLPLESEAESLLEGSQLSDPERERLNRLILEAVFPNEVRKLYVHGWRSVMQIYGLLGIVVAAYFFWIVRNRPDEHPRVNRAEQRVIYGSPAVKPTVQSSRVDRPKLPVRAVLTSRSLWCLSMVQFGTNVGWVFLVTWLPRYFFEVQRVPFEKRNLIATLVMIGGWAGMLFGGWLTDRLADQLGRRWGRALPVCLSRFVGMAAFLFVMLEPSPYTAAALFALVAFSTDSGSPAVWAFNQDVGGRYIASVLGWGNMWGNLGAALSTVVLERIVAYWGWNFAFLTCAFAFFVSGVCGIVVDATKPIDIVPESGDAETPPET